MDNSRVQASAARYGCALLRSRQSRRFINVPTSVTSPRTHNFGTSRTTISLHANISAHPTEIPGPKRAVRFLGLGWPNPILAQQTIACLARSSPRATLLNLRDVCLQQSVFETIASHDPPVWKSVANP